MYKNIRKLISICLSVLMSVCAMFTGDSAVFAAESALQTVTYTDDFSGYTTETAPVNTTSLTTLGAFKASANNNKTIASGKGLDFIALSGGASRAYSVLDIDNSALLSVAGSDQGASNTGVRLTDGSFTDLTNVKVSFTANSSAAPGSGFRLFHDSSSGKSFVFYVIPTYSTSENHVTWKSGSALAGLSGAHAYVAQEYDGKFEIIALKSYTVDKNGKGETFEWDVAIDNGTVSWTLSRNASESDWVGSFTEGATFVRANKDDTEAVTSTIQNLSESEYTYPLSLIGNSDAQGIYMDSLALSKSYPTKFNLVSLTGTLRVAAAGFPFEEDFEDYALTEDYVSAADLNVAGGWYTRKLSNWGYDGKAKVAVITNPLSTDKVIAVEGRGAYNYPHMFPSVEHNVNTYNMDDYYTYKFDYYAPNTSSVIETGGGIRFNYCDGDFYELYFVGDNGYSGAKTVLHKRINGIYTGLNASITSTGLSGHRLGNKWYTVEINYHQGNISWTVAEKDTGTQVQTGSYYDNRALRNDSCTMRLFAGGQANTYAYFDNIKVSSTVNDGDKLVDIPILRDENVTYITDNGDGTHTYTDSFNGYDYLNANVDDDNPTKGKTYDNRVAYNEYASWNFSEVYSDIGYPYAYVDNSSSLFYTSGSGASYSELYYPAVVNLDMNEFGETAGRLTEITATTARVNGNARHGIRIAVSDDEQTYYEIGRGAGWDWAEIDNGDGTTTILEESGAYRQHRTRYNPTGIYGRAPYIIKCTDGVREVVAFVDNSKAIGACNNADWTITIDEDNLITATAATANGTFTMTVQGDEDILKGFRYPVAMWSASSGTFDDISITYVPRGPVFADNGETATVCISPELYSKTATSLKSVIGFYDSEGDMLTATETAVTSDEPFSVDIPGAYSYAKIMIYDGNELLDTVSTLPAKRTSVSDDKIVISCIGDSLTGGDSSPSSKLWPTYLNSLLGENYRVYNFGVPGSIVRDGHQSQDTSTGFEDYHIVGNGSWLLTKAHEDFLTITPDIVLIMMGTNDMPGSGMADTEKEKFNESYQRMIDEAFNLGAKEVICAQIPVRGNKLSEDSADFDNYEYNSRDYMGELPSKVVPRTTGRDIINPLIRDLVDANVSQGKNVRLIDNYYLYSDAIDSPVWLLSYDGTHFIDAMSMEFAQNFYDAIMRKTWTELSGDKATLNVHSISTVTTDIMVAVYEDDSLKDVKVFKDESITGHNRFNPVLSAKALDVSDMEIATGDKIKVMLWDEQNLTPYTTASCIAGKVAYTKGEKAIISGNTVSGSEVGVTVYKGSELVFADSAAADQNGYYEFSHVLSLGTYTVMISDGTSTTLTID